MVASLWWFFFAFLFFFKEEESKWIGIGHRSNLRSTRKKNQPIGIELVPHPPPLPPLSLAHSVTIRFDLWSSQSIRWKNKETSSSFYRSRRRSWRWSVHFGVFFLIQLKTIFWWVSVRWKRVLPGLPSFFFFKKYLAGARFFLRKKDFPIEFFFFFAKRFNENNFTYWSCLVFSTFDCTEFSSWERWDFEDDFTLAPNFWVRLPGFTSYFSTWSSLIVLLLSALFCVGILTITGFYLVFFFFGWRVGHPVQSWVRPWPTK